MNMSDIVNVFVVTLKLVVDSKEGYVRLELDQMGQWAEDGV